MKIMKDRKKEEKGPATLDKFKQMAGKRGNGCWILFTCDATCKN